MCGGLGESVGSNIDKNLVPLLEFWIKFVYHANVEE